MEEGSALNILHDYDSDASAEREDFEREKEDVVKRRKVCSEKKKAPPIPPELFGKKRDPVEEKQGEETAQGSKRKRRVEHMAGQWATHISVPLIWPFGESVEDRVMHVCEKHALPRPQLLSPSPSSLSSSLSLLTSPPSSSSNYPFHISLSRTLFLSHHDLPHLRECIATVAQSVPSSSFRFSCGRSYKFFLNEDASTLFLALLVEHETTGFDMFVRLIQLVDSNVIRVFFRDPDEHLFHTDPQPHWSIACWDMEDVCRNIPMHDVEAVLVHKVFHEEDWEDSSVLAKDIMLRFGGKTFLFPLKDCDLSLRHTSE
eukprot:TRINITY_DN7915_c0_g1_i1.p1 TRINITY_DN7915_c0_g1~~TRINITY_DN7915_c0_g1_i1.p1  ORF type:complete len:315 (-),score=85.07 TRINITY_DN7915_c0_g1_i1:808-1752(-)